MTAGDQQGVLPQGVSPLIPCCVKKGGAEGSSRMSCKRAAVYSSTLNSSGESGRSGMSSKRAGKRRHNRS